MLKKAEYVLTEGGDEVHLVLLPCLLWSKPCLALSPLRKLKVAFL